MNEHALLKSVLSQQVGGPVDLQSVEARTDGEQGLSGNPVTYYDVRFSSDDGVSQQAVLVTKPMPLHERRALLRLNEQGLAVPQCACDDFTSESALVCMTYLQLRATMESDAKAIAQALAQIHVANLGKAEQLAWLPLADASYYRDWIVGDCWRLCWESLLADGEYIDGYGNRHGVPKAGGDFSAEFQAYTPQIEAVAQRFIETMQTLWHEGDSLTLIHGDLHGDHTMRDGAAVRIIDWGQARYGSFYLDLPNLFSAETVHHYHTALAKLGHAVPIAQFMDNFHAVQAFVGFKYFGIGLWNWCFGDPPHQASHVTYWLHRLGIAA